MIPGRGPNLRKKISLITIIILILPSIILINTITPSMANSSSTTFLSEDECEDNCSEPNRIVNISTNWGMVKFELYEKRAPITTENFIMLTEENFYDGIKFHRIIDDFVIQTGDPNTRDNNPYNDGMGGSDQTIPLEIHEELTHVDGAVGMARSSDPDSASSQFYICDGEQHGLDGDYAVFGIVIDGMDTVRRIAQAETYPDYRVVLKDHPVDDIIMERVTIEPGIPDPCMDNGTDDDGKAKINPGPGFEFLPVFFAVVACIFVLKFNKRKRM
jgi:peptidyl-prolyl cis-trans isomerase B (cyclophilin B)